ncbi:MAG: CRISPR-associated helicase Cas3' [Rhodospirillaceae bacterium]|nr:CRISPR-associated helicase Cas3' [Rhodospirillaceae bacterium]
MLWAHTVDGKSQTAWEPLNDHLRAVGARCGRFAGKFGAAEFGEIAGRLHDLGKAKAAFQRYLEGGLAEPHAAEGAKAAVAIFGEGLGRMLAFAIAGHHAGLANGVIDGGGLTCLEKRLDQAVDLTDDARSLQLPAVRSKPPALVGPDAFAVQFFIRMLFSCLVDADRLETEAFYARVKGDPVERGWPGALATLKDRLDAHLATLGGTGAVNAVRAEVQAACRDAAKQKTGLFSLTVPTGGGKTLSSLAFALDHAVENKLDRVVYVIPYTSIIDQTAKVFRDALGDTENDIVLEHHSAFDWDGPAKDREKDDEGQDGLKKLRLAAENWDRPIVVTTAVQFFESLFSNRPSRCRKLHNLARSVVVLDEAQTLPLPVLRPCLAALTELARGYGSSVVLCTATQPAVRAKDGFTAPEALEEVREIAPDPPRLYRTLKRVRVEQAGEVGDADLVQALAGTEQILMIVNSRTHARALAVAAQGAEAEGVRLLTTALTAADRRAILEEIRCDLTAKRPVRLVATSLIEAGVDISFPVVWRALAGVDSLAQAAGRCNRENELGADGGRVVVFAPEDGHPPPLNLKRFAEVAGRVLGEHQDPLTLEAVKAYFGGVYWRAQADQLDALMVGEPHRAKRGVLRAIHTGKGGHSYPFADIGAAFRLIEDTQAPIIIPASKHLPRNAPADLLRALEVAERPGGLARRLQPYLVQVPRKTRTDLCNAGAAVAVQPDRFGDQFVKLVDATRYDPALGLDWAEPELRGIGQDIC